MDDEFPLAGVPCNKLWRASLLFLHVFAGGSEHSLPKTCANCSTYPRRSRNLREQALGFDLDLAPSSQALLLMNLRRVAVMSNL
jgi:hypothetical protein